MPRTILSRRKRRCALSATGTWKPEEEKDARGVTCFMEENEISLREMARFDEYKRLKWKRAVFYWFSCRVTLRPAVLATGRILPGVSRQLDNFLRPQGAFLPGFYSLRGGWVNRLAPEAPLIRGMPTGP